MKKLRKALHLLGFMLFILLAACGFGFMAAFLPGSKERYMDKEIRVEQVDKKEEEEEKT